METVILTFFDTFHTVNPYLFNFKTFFTVFVTLTWKKKKLCKVSAFNFGHIKNAAALFKGNTESVTSE